MASLIESKQKVTVLRWTEELCRCLEAQYRNYSLRSAMDNQAMSGATDEYLQERINKIENDEECIKFTISSGKKYHKIIQNDFRNGKYESAGVHAFVDKKTGEVYKPASWKAPAKHVRYDMRIINQREYMYANCDWAGGYLYMR
jgi:hypothetical protein